MENWKVIVEYPSYSISSLGRVKNNTTNKVLKADIEEDVEITEDGQDELQEYGIDVLGFSDYRDCRLLVPNFRLCQYFYLTYYSGVIPFLSFEHI